MGKRVRIWVDDERPAIQLTANGQRTESCPLTADGG